MKVGVIGSGGREHALCFSLKNSNNIKQIYCFPGNAGTNSIATNVNIDINDFEKLKDFIIQSIDIYSGTLGIDQSLVKEFLNSTSNFINGNNKIILSVKPPNPVSVNDLSSDMMMQNYEGLVDKLNIRISNF